MLTRIFGLLGKESGKKAQTKKAPARPASATAHLFEKQSEKPAQRGRPGSEEKDGGFNPYDTGKFDRSASWERISKTQR